MREPQERLCQRPGAESFRTTFFFEAAGTLDIEAVPLEIAQAEDIGPAFETLKGRADALYVVIDSLVTTHANRIGCFERLADQSWTGDLPLRARWRDQHARYMAAFGTFVRDQPILVGHWSDGHHIFHGSPAFRARRNCVLASGSWFRCHNTRPLLVLPILEQRRTCSLVRRKGQSTLGERDRSSARTARFS
jgi:hypothetical protein